MSASGDYVPKPLSEELAGRDGKEDGIVFDDRTPDVLRDFDEVLGEFNKLLNEFKAQRYSSAKERILDRCVELLKEKADNVNSSSSSQFNKSMYNNKFKKAQAELEEAKPSKAATADADGWETGGVQEELRTFCTYVRSFCDKGVDGWAKDAQVSQHCSKIGFPDYTENRDKAIDLGLVERGRRLISDPQRVVTIGENGNPVDSAIEKKDLFPESYLRLTGNGQSVETHSGLVDGKISYYDPAKSCGRVSIGSCTSDIGRTFFLKVCKGFNSDGPQTGMSVKVRLKKNVNDKEYCAHVEPSQSKAVGDITTAIVGRAAATAPVTATSAATDIAPEPQP